MTQDESCQLPCWWQIELGTPLSEIDLQFRGSGLPDWSVSSSDLGDGNKMGSVRLGYSDPDDPTYYKVDVWTRFYEVQDEVVFIEVNALRPLWHSGQAEFLRDWEPFFLDSVIKKLGEPAFLYLLPITESEPGIVNETLLLYYPEQGINISFEFRAFETDEGAKEICLDPSNIRQLRLSLFVPEETKQWAPYLLPPSQIPEVAESYERYSWEVRTGQDFASFYRSFQESQQACVQLD